MPVTLTVCTLRYWMVGLTGAAHPASAICAALGRRGVLVIYRWMVEQTVAATNTLTHAILGFPVVANGLASIIAVLFGGALLLGAGGVFGAFLVIVGVVFAAGLFASKELLTVISALLICAGPPFIALSAIPELSHLARAGAHALMAIVLVPVGWTLLFADRRRVDAGCDELHRRRERRSTRSYRGGVRGADHVRDRGEAPADAVRRAPPHPQRREPCAAVAGSSARRERPRCPARSGCGPRTPDCKPPAYQGVPSLGRSAGRAAGALGAPAGGPLELPVAAGWQRLLAAASCPVWRARVARSRVQVPLAVLGRARGGVRDADLACRGDHRERSARSARGDGRRPPEAAARVRGGRGARRRRETGASSAAGKTPATGVLGDPGRGAAGASASRAAEHRAAGRRLRDAAPRSARRSHMPEPPPRPEPAQAGEAIIAIAAGGEHTGAEGHDERTPGRSRTPQTRRTGSPAPQPAEAQRTAQPRRRSERGHVHGVGRDPPYFQIAG